MASRNYRGAHTTVEESNNGDSGYVSQSASRMSSLTLTSREQGSYDSPSPRATSADSAMEIDNGDATTYRSSARFRHLNPTGSFENLTTIPSGDEASGGTIIRVGTGVPSPATRRRGPALAGTTMGYVSRPNGSAVHATAHLREASTGGREACVDTSFSPQPDTNGPGRVCGAVTLDRHDMEEKKGQDSNGGMKREDTSQKNRPTPMNDTGAGQEKKKPHQSRPEPAPVMPPQCQPRNPNPTPAQTLNPQMQIFVKNMDGKLHAITVRKSDLVDDLMAMIRDKLGVPIEQQVLNYAGKNLARGMRLQHYDIKEGCTVFLTGRLRGG